MKGYIAMNDKMDRQTVDNVERAIGDLVSKINGAVSPDDVARSIGAHTAAILNRVTAESRLRIANLFDALRDMDEHICENEKRLRAEIDRHVGIANSAQRASNIIAETIENWKRGN